MHCDANRIRAHNWRERHATWFDLTRRAGHVVGRVGDRLVRACPA